MFDVDRVASSAVYSIDYGIKRIHFVCAISEEYCKFPSVILQPILSQEKKKYFQAILHVKL